MDRFIADRWADALYRMEEGMMSVRVEFVRLIEETADLWNERELIDLDERLKIVMWAMERLRNKLGDEREVYDRVGEVQDE